MKKELSIFAGLLVLLSLIMHSKEWLDHPVEHFMGLPSSGVFGIGAYHPLFFAVLLYGVFTLFRAIFRSFSK